MVTCRTILASHVCWSLGDLVQYLLASWLHMHTAYWSLGDLLQQRTLRILDHPFKIVNSNAGRQENELGHVSLSTGFEQGFVHFHDCLSVGGRVHCKWTCSF